MNDPMASFEVKNVVPLSIFGWDVSLTNSAIFMLLTSATIFALFYTGTADRGIIPSKFQVAIEKAFQFVGGIVKTNANANCRLVLLPYMCALFLFIALGNVFGLLPFAFSFTSQLVVTLGLALGVFLASVIVGVCKQGAGYLRHFCPRGIPPYIIPFFVAIELMSFLFRPISLGIRLFSNMVSGHLVIKVMAGFAVALAGTVATSPLTVVPVAVNVLLNVFKFAVCLLQAYVFVVLSCIYLSESFEATED
jgi:F-type H+-transporting ATPase subunit a